MKDRLEAGKIGCGRTIEIAQERDYGVMDCGGDEWNGQIGEIFMM